MDNDEIKRQKYIALKNKMRSIQTKSNYLNSNVDNLKSSLKMCFSVDGEVYNESNFNIVDKGIDDLNKDISNVIDIINRQI